MVRCTETVSSCYNVDMSAPGILIVEDEPAIAESLHYALGRAGFETRTASTLLKAKQFAGWPNLIVLDLMLPDGSGFDFIRALRRARDATPIIVLSSREDESDRVTALEQGADDYVTKPFSPREMVARVRAVLRRLPYPASPPSGVSLDHTTRQASAEGQPLELTRVEFDLLAQLLDSPGRVYARAELIDLVWGQDFAMTDRTVDSHIKSLRRKIADACGTRVVIQTVRGVGFRICSEPEEGGE